MVEFEDLASACLQPLNETEAAHLHRCRCWRRSSYLRRRGKALRASTSTGGLTRPGGFSRDRHNALREDFVLGDYQMSRIQEQGRVATRGQWVDGSLSVAQTHGICPILADSVRLGRHYHQRQRDKDEQEGRRLHSICHCSEHILPSPFHRSYAAPNLCFPLTCRIPCGSRARFRLSRSLRHNRCTRIPFRVQCSVYPHRLQIGDTESMA
jgi:hypothetical protein